MAVVCQVGGKALDAHQKIRGRVSVQQPHRSPFCVRLASSLPLSHFPCVPLSLLCLVLFTFVVLPSRNRHRASPVPNNSSNNSNHVIVYIHREIDIRHKGH
ncbi:hypothetical protein ACJBU6_01983 [Exserohilum turcicum]